jgi:uncharacterized protein (TIGR03790 family)
MAKTLLIVVAILAIIYILANSNINTFSVMPDSTCEPPNVIYENKCVKSTPQIECLRTGGSFDTGECIYYTVCQVSDTNCDGKITRAELGVAVQAWTADTLSRDELGMAIQTWSEGLGDLVSYDDVLLVTNTNSPDSIAISDYFKSKRTITHEVFIQASTSETVSYDVYNQTIQTPIVNYLVSNGLSSSINYIVLTKGVPIKIWQYYPARTECGSYLTNGSCSYYVNYANKTYSASVDSTLVIANGNYFVNRRVKSNSILTNPMYTKTAHASKVTYDIYLVTRLTGYTVDDAKKLVLDSPIQPIQGKVLLDRAVSRQYDCNLTSSYCNWDMRIADANSFILSSGYQTIYDNTNTFIMNQEGLSGYVSWGSNDGHGPAYGWNLTFLPGSIGETAVSTSARSFQPGTTYGQSLIADLIHSGISGVKGYAYEPYLSAIAKPEILYNRYLNGYNLAESFYMASPRTDWMDIVVGDPKLAIR